MYVRLLDYSGRFCLLLFGLLLGSCQTGESPDDRAADSDYRGYVFNREPLVRQPYAPLPLGSVKPKGWLREQLSRMSEGMAGRLDELYFNVGEDNAWIGGRGDNWERGPYWLDGLTPLAFTLDDPELIEKVERWVEWTLESRQPSGYFGPSPKTNYKEYPDRPGNFIQTENAGDWWPRMVMLKVLRSYYEATGDKRVLELMTNYFRYQQEMLPERPLDHWTWWGGARGGENQSSIYWLYNRTGDEFLLDLASTVFEQTYDWTNGFAAGDLPSHHGVNVAMGVKQPALQYLQTEDSTYLDAVEQGLDFLMTRHGQPQGMFSGDEPLHGTNPTQGTEMCTVVELMYSLEALTQITGDTRYADHLERVAYNALPTQHRDDYMGRQYFQQPNQIRLGQGRVNFITGPTGRRLMYGLTSGYPCCTTNMHQGWPKYVRNLWLASEDGGLAALFYGASSVDGRVGEGVKVHFEEETNYPFDDEIRFTFGSGEPVTFPLHLRIPGWTDGRARIEINGELWAEPEGGQIVRVERTWQDGDELSLQLPMTITSRRWHENSASVERGPLVYALRIREDWRKVSREEYAPRWEQEYNVLTWEVHPEDPWNYGLVLDADAPGESFEVVKQDQMPDYPWSLDTVPIRLTGEGKRIPWWKEYNVGAGPLPYSPVYTEAPVEEVTLIPYGATTLRISEFPVVRR